MEVEFQNVDFRFRSSEPWIIRDFNLSLEKGEFHILLGPSGCGKTTIINLLAGFEKANTGLVLVNGRKVNTPGRDRIVIFQGDDSLYSWLTAVENVEFGLRVEGLGKTERRAKAMEFINLVGLSGHEHKFPAELSGGMKQRVQVARALVCRSPILLMDEPFGALDAQTRSILQEELTLIWEQSDCTILFITHDISEAVILADRVSIMSAAPSSAIKKTLMIDLPRPRSPGDEAFAHYYQNIHEILSNEVRREPY